MSEIILHIYVLVFYDISNNNSNLLLLQLLVYKLFINWDFSYRSLVKTFHEIPITVSLYYIRSKFK